MTSNPIFSKSWISEKNEFSIFSIFQKIFFQQIFDFSKNRIGGQKTLKKIENFRQKIEFFRRKIWEMRVMSKSNFWMKKFLGGGVAYIESKNGVHHRVQRKKLHINGYGPNFFRRSSILRTWYLNLVLSIFWGFNDNFIVSRTKRFFWGLHNCQSITINKQSILDNRIYKKQCYKAIGCGWHSFRGCFCGGEDWFAVYLGLGGMQHPHAAPLSHKCLYYAYINVIILHLLAEFWWIWLFIPFSL